MGLQKLSEQVTISIAIWNKALAFSNNGKATVVIKVKSEFVRHGMITALTEKVIFMGHIKIYVKDSQSTIALELH